MSREKYWNTYSLNIDDFDYRNMTRTFAKSSYRLAEDEAKCSLCENEIIGKFIPINNNITDSAIWIKGCICKSCWLYPTYKCENCDAEIEAPELCENCSKDTYEGEE